MLSASEAKIKALKSEIGKYADSYDDLRFLSDFLTIQIDKYKAVELAGKDLTDETRDIFYQALESITANLTELTKEGIPE